MSARASSRVVHDRDGRFRPQRAPIPPLTRTIRKNTPWVGVAAARSTDSARCRCPTNPEALRLRTTGVTTSRARSTSLPPDRPAQPRAVLRALAGVVAAGAAVGVGPPGGSAGQPGRLAAAGRGLRADRRGPDPGEGVRRAHVRHGRQADPRRQRGGGAGHLRRRRRPGRVAASPHRRRRDRPARRRRGRGCAHPWAVDGRRSLPSSPASSACSHCTCCAPARFLTPGRLQRSTQRRDAPGAASSQPSAQPLPSRPSPEPAGSSWDASATRRPQPAVRLACPAPASAAKALPDGVQVEGVSTFTTPAADFYRVDISLVTPHIDASTWSLTLDGMVDHPLTLTYDDLLAMPLVERDITLTCVSNEVGGPYVSTGRWLGVPFRDLIARVGVRPGVDQVYSYSLDSNYTCSTPFQALTDGRDAMVVVGLNGEPLADERGYPGPHAGAGTVRLRLRHQVAAAHRVHQLRGPHRLLDGARLGHRRPDPHPEPHRGAAVAGNAAEGQAGHRRRRLGPAPRDRQGRDPHRRGRVEGSQARRRRWHRPVAAVVLRLRPGPPGCTAPRCGPPTSTASPSRRSAPPPREELSRRWPNPGSLRPRGQSGRRFLPRPLLAGTGLRRR